MSCESDGESCSGSFASQSLQSAKCKIIGLVDLESTIQRAEPQKPFLHRDCWVQRPKGYRTLNSCELLEFEPDEATVSRQLMYQFIRAEGWPRQFAEPEPVFLFVRWRH